MAGISSTQDTEAGGLPDVMLSNYHLNQGSIVRIGLSQIHKKAIVALINNDYILPSI